MNRLASLSLLTVFLWFNSTTQADESIKHFDLTTLLGSQQHHPLFLEHRNDLLSRYSLDELSQCYDDSIKDIQANIFNVSFFQVAHTFFVSLFCLHLFVLIRLFKLQTEYAIKTRKLGSTPEKLLKQSQSLSESIVELAKLIKDCMQHADHEDNVKYGLNWMTPLVSTCSNDNRCLDLPFVESIGTSGDEFGRPQSQGEPSTM